MIVTTTSFEALARKVAQAYGLPGARIAIIEHPLGGIDEDAVHARAESVIDDVLALVMREA